MGFMLVSCLSLIYSLGVYLYRVKMIRQRRAVRYHDKFGPTALAALLLIAVLLNFVMRIKQDGWF